MKRTITDGLAVALTPLLWSSGGRMRASRIDLGKATQLPLTRVSLPLSQPEAEKVLKFARCPHSLTSTVRGFALMTRTAPCSRQLP